MRILLVFLASTCLITSSTAQQAGNRVDRQQQLYLLAAGEQDTGGYSATPVTLYRIGSTGRLLPVRVVEPTGPDATVTVVPTTNTIFLVHPADAIGPPDDPAWQSTASDGIKHPQTVTILHFDDPLRVDDVAINPRGLFEDHYTTVAAASTPASDELLLPLQYSGGGSPPSLLQNLTGVKENDKGKYEHIQPENWNSFANIRLEGQGRGSNNGTGWSITEAKVLGDHVVLWHLGNTEQHPIPISSVPPELKGRSEETILSILASNERYLVLSLDCSNGNGVQVPCESHDLFVLSRQTNRWKTIPTMGSAGVRLFGSWLTVAVNLNVHSWNLVHQPVLENTDDAGRLIFWFNPGILLVRNLDDEREFGLTTSREDSEILNVNGDTLYYRIDDAIYRAKIYTFGILQSALLVKGPDVSNIHWLFWSTNADAQLACQNVDECNKLGTQKLKKCRYAGSYSLVQAAGQIRRGQP